MYTYSERDTWVQCAIQQKKAIWKIDKNVQKKNKKHWIVYIVMLMVHNTKLNMKKNIYITLRQLLLKVHTTHHIEQYVYI